MEADIKINEGWAIDVAPKGDKTHYYKNGVSLCGRRTKKPYMTNFDKRLGNKYFNDCITCIKKQKELK